MARDVTTDVCPSQDISVDGGTLGFLNVGTALENAIGNLEIGIAWDAWMQQEIMQVCEDYKAILDA